MKRVIPHFAIAAIALGVALLASDGASAQSVWNTLQTKGSEGFVNARNLIFIGGGFGFIGLCTLAMYGRFQFKWFASLIGGMVLLAVVGSVIEYVTTDTSSGQATTFSKDMMKDTLATR